MENNSPNSSSSSSRHIERDRERVYVLESGKKYIEKEINENNNNNNNNSNNIINNNNISRVLLLRSLARGVTEIDVEGFVQPFTKGYSPKIYLQASAGRAFVEFVDEEAAANALNYFSLHPIQLKGMTVNVTYSKRDAVVTTHENANNLSEQFKILLASVTNLLFTVDIDLLYLLFSKYGTVEKIVTFSKSPTMYQALIQFKYAEDAKQALCALHNRNIYDGCNTLQIQPSRLTELIVKSNSNKSVDYTLQSEYNGNAQINNNNFSKFNGGISHGVLATPSSINNNYGGGSYGVNSGILSMRYGVGGGNNHQMYSGVGNYSGSGAGGVLNSGVSSGNAPASGISNAFNYVSSAHHLPKEIRDLTLDHFNKNQTPVVICYNLPTTDINCTKLFNLFSLYGTVQRIKIFRDKPDAALIQYSDSFYASLACHFLQGAVIMGNELQIDFSKNLEVKLPTNSSYLYSNVTNDKNDDNDADVKTKSFFTKDQRYGGDDVEKFIKGACRPTSTLFVANIQDDVEENEIRKLFEIYGSINKIVFRSPKEGSRTQMAFVSMSSELEATNALINLHNTLIRSRQIKVAFSKTVI